MVRLKHLSLSLMLLSVSCKERAAPESNLQAGVQTPVTDQIMQKVKERFAKAKDFTPDLPNYFLRGGEVWTCEVWSETLGPWVKFSNTSSTVFHKISGFWQIPHMYKFQYYEQGLIGFSPPDKTNMTSLSAALETAAAVMHIRNEDDSTILIEEFGSFGKASSKFTSELEKKLGHAPLKKAISAPFRYQVCTRS